MDGIALLIICSMTLLVIICREVYIKLRLGDMTGKFMTVKSSKGLYYKIQYRYKGTLSYRVATSKELKTLKQLRLL